MIKVQFIDIWFELDIYVWTKICDGMTVYGMKYYVDMVI